MDHTTECKPKAMYACVRVYFFFLQAQEKIFMTRHRLLRYVTKSIVSKSTFDKLDLSLKLLFRRLCMKTES